MAPNTFIGVVTGLVLSVCTVLVSFLFATDALRNNFEVALVLALVVWLLICGMIALKRYRTDRRVSPSTLIAIEQLIDELRVADDTASPDYS